MSTDVIFYLIIVFLDGITVGLSIGLVLFNFYMKTSTKKFIKQKK